MAEYIEREATIEFIRLNYCKDCISCNGIRCRACSFDDAMLALEDVPAADVVEVVHGHNATSMHPVDEFLCSVCGFCCADYTETKYDEDGDYAYSCECEFDYCPKCGAKMDSERR